MLVITDDPLDTDCQENECLLTYIYIKPGSRKRCDTYCRCMHTIQLVNLWTSETSLLEPHILSLGMQAKDRGGGTTIPFHVALSKLEASSTPINGLVLKVDM